MGNIDIINRIARVSCINVVTYIVFINLIKYKKNNYNKVIVITLISIIETVISIIATQYFPEVFVIIACYCIHGFIISIITNNKFSYSVIVTFISLVITYVTYIISMILSAIILKILVPTIQINNILGLFIGIMIQCIIIHRLFKIRRLKNGLSFLQNRQKLDSIGLVGLTLCGVTLLIYSFFGKEKSFKVNENSAIGIIIVSLCLSIWISKKLTAFYKKKLKEQTIELLEGEIKEKDKEISKILEENKAIATVNHKYSSRIKSLEKVSAKISQNPKIMEIMKTEFGEEFADFEIQIKKLSEEFSGEMNNKVKHNGLPKTGIFGIDNLIEYMNDEANKDNIKLDVKINGNINYMVENVIEQNKFETLLADHIKDAIIAIKHSDNTYRNILVIIGIVDEHYEVCIYDTGIEFEIDTLIHLGTKAITTHKETGGSGIGFMTTFETLRETKGSLIIEEKHQISNTDYTKAVRIKFDGKGEYKIRSYRAEKIRQHKKSERILIENN